MIQRSLKPPKYTDLFINNGDHFAQLPKTHRMQRSPEGYEDVQKQDQYGIIAREARIPRRILAVHILSILMLQNLLDNDGRYRELQRLWEMTSFGAKLL
jgi:hypothetical protein